MLAASSIYIILASCLLARYETVIIYLSGTVIVADKAVTYMDTIIALRFN
jgi:hypothetical protein